MQHRRWLATAPSRKYRKGPTPFWSGAKSHFLKGADHLVDGNARRGVYQTNRRDIDATSSHETGRRRGEGSAFAGDFAASRRDFVGGKLSFGLAPKLVLDGGNECLRDRIRKKGSRRFGEIWLIGNGIPKRTALASLLWCRSFSNRVLDNRLRRRTFAGIGDCPPAGKCSGRLRSAPRCSRGRRGSTYSAPAAAQAGRSICGPLIATTGLGRHASAWPAVLMVPRIGADAAWPLRRSIDACSVRRWNLAQPRSARQDRTQDFR
jgi:hypothetical protein